ncbi:SAYSvFN domain-containing protein 1 [Trichogramma pretiosum]|uniref:SAYSvFN domain-containing protein n=1 Tax=Trichogramma kaykai TaxID=54128 RepID=A0ABD2WQR7_9HYME|nr:SAYSvFN domain-containing protein 1 [Trichogramma pretiosum]
MEEKLRAYRRQKRREDMVETAKNTFKEALSWQKNLILPTIHNPSRDDDLESIMSEESIDFSPPPSPFFTRTLCFLYFLLWTTIYVIAIKLEFGAVYFVLSLLVFIYYNTRTGPKKKGELSAYSVFNPNCETIQGTLDPKQFEQEIRYGGLSVH